MTLTGSRTQWDLRHLREHLQGLVDLELWTIPYYMSAMYSIIDPADRAFRLIESVVREEMLHLQLACNIANAYGCVPRLRAPAYRGTNVPHIDFSLDRPNPTAVFHPYSAELGPLDAARINTMCLIEYPGWKTARPAEPCEDHSSYGSIAEFYDATATGMRQLVDELRGGVNQVDEFAPFYDRFGDQRITANGQEGLVQALAFVELIVDQGEGHSQADTAVAVRHRNTADGFEESWSHFRRFEALHDGMLHLPPVHSGAADPPTEAGREAQRALKSEFARLLRILEDMFAGRPATGFGACMAEVGGACRACWEHGAVPRFS